MRTNRIIRLSGWALILGGLAIVVGSLFGDEGLFLGLFLVMPIFVGAGMLGSGGFHFWDSLTAALFADGSLAEFEEIELHVVEQEGPESGYTKPTGGGAVVRVAVSADRKRFEQLLVTVLNGQTQ